MQKTLDLSIKTFETTTFDGGYLSNNGKTYQTYMDNKKWETFKADMEKNYASAFEEYGAGSGGEMKDKNNLPPKMACYGSSSRMIYNLCKDILGFHFEYKLETKIGGTAHLDGFLKKNDKYIFMEAKCREPYGKKAQLIDNNYKELYSYIDSTQNCNLNIETEDAGSELKVKFSVGNHIISKFDIKQMICHLLGIAVKFLNEYSDKKISFLYLCYNPKLIQIVDEKKKKDILDTYNQMCIECKYIDFKKLFETIVTYLHKELKVGILTEKELGKLVSDFSFTLCDQSDYIDFI